MDPEISVVVPVYRSPSTLAPLLDRVRAALGPLGRSWEVVFVDDSGPDPRAWAVLERLHADDPGRVAAVRLMRNFGQHNALMCGFREARGRYVVTLDDDLQNPPEEIPRLLDALESQGLDLVYGSIDGGKKHAAFRNLGSWAVIRFSQFVFQNRVDGSSYRAIRGELAKSILRYDLNFTFVDGLLAWNTQQIGAIPVRHDPRASGRSGYSLRKLLTLSLNLFTNFSLVPLQAVSLLGLVSAGLGLLLGLVFILMYLFGRIGVSGYASLIVTVLVMGGLQLLSLGVMGEYLGRIHLNINRKPQFVVRRRLGAAPPGEEAVPAGAPAEAGPGDFMGGG